MPITRRNFLAASMAAGAFALLGVPRTTPLVRERWYLFGTLLDVTIAGERRDELQPVLAKLATSLKKMNDDWHPWQPGMMGSINSAIKAGRAIEIDGHLQSMLNEVRELYEQSDGRFNPAIGRIIAEWGFHNWQQESWQPPARETIQGLLESHASPLDINIRNSLLTCANRNVQIDLGGYAKGYAVNLGMQLLREHGIENAIINAGGDLQVTGSEASRPWRIGIRHPQRQGHIAWLETSYAEAVYTSGNYERYHESAGIRYPHIINPVTGMPVNGIASATVIHSSGARADAAATALVVAGVRQWREVAARMGIEQAMVVDASGRVEMTPLMKNRISMV